MRRLLSSAALLAAAAFPVLADERMEHAEWVSEFREGMGEASTKESGMSGFGMQCSEDGCRFFYENGIKCEPGATYPVVIATSVGSIAVETVCAPVMTADGEAGRYWFNDSPQFSDALMQSDTVGVAFPLANGQFKISQFLMNGYGEATERVAAGLRARKAEREAREAAEREQRAREAAERARKAQEAAERARQAAEQAAERARKAAEQEAAERARKAAEQEAAERARKVAEQEAAERVRKAAEEAAAERARIEAEQEAARKAVATEAVPAPETAPAAAKQPEEPAPVEIVSPQNGPGSDSKAAPDSGGASGDVPVSAEPGEASPDQPSDTDSPPASQPSPRGNRLPARL